MNFISFTTMDNKKIYIPTKEFEKCNFVCFENQVTIISGNKKQKIFCSIEELDNAIFRNANRKNNNKYMKFNLFLYILFLLYIFVDLYFLIME